MTKTPAVRQLLAGFVLLLGGVTQAVAQSPAPAEMLDPKLGPKFEDVNCTVPTPEELKNCSVELVKGKVPNSTGWLLLDANKKPLRRYFNSTGRMDKDGHTKVDTWSYYKDGVEVYREFDTSGKGIHPNNFRWLNTGGMKWGVGGLDPRTGKWTINSWRMISAEEVGFEAFQAVAKNDPARLQALFITEAEMQIVKLPSAKIEAVAAMQRQAPQKLAKLVQTVKLAGVKFDGVEGATPSYDTTGGDFEIIKFPSRAIRYSIGEKQHGWIHTGEMIQVGMAAWRMVDVPTNTDPLVAGGGIAPPPPAGNPQLEKPLNLLAELDKNPRSDSILAKNKEVEAYYRKRIELVKEIMPLDKESERESWYKQLFDNMTARAQNSGDDAVIAELKQLKDGVAAKMPGSNLAAYGAYREMWTRYAVGMAKIKDDRKLIDVLQEKWLDDLSDFVKKFSKADDTPDALSQLAIGCEFAGKIEEAKRWYKELFTSFPDHHHAPRARGSLARLNLVGNLLTLSAPLLNGTKTFNITQLKGKVVIVHYWSRGSSNYEDDFTKLKRIMSQVGAKNDVELVSISLDDDAGKAREAVAAAQLPGIHLFQASNNASGFNSPLATQYGIHILPTLFMVGRNGVVTNNALQIGDILTELKRVQ
jgi:hypothetical protein